MPKLILCSEHREIAKELRKQLKAHGLTVKFRSKREWCDQIAVEVSKIPPPPLPLRLPRPLVMKCPDCGLPCNDCDCYRGWK